MAWALIVAVSSVVAGALLGWWGRSGPVLGPVRTFALVTSVAVALSQLLPDALAAIGIAALVAFLAGLFVPTLLERLVSSRRDVVGLEIGFAGLLLHKIGDGLALGMFTSELHEGHHHAEVLIAIGAHTVPIVALVFLVYAQRANVRAAIVRSIALGVAACAGVLFASEAAVEVLHEVEPWITATVAGTLLHVVFHDWRSVPNGTPKAARRIGDLLALAMGAALVAMGSAHSHGEATDSLRPALGDVLLGVVLVASPILLIALAVDAWFRALPRGSDRGFVGRWLAHIDTRLQKMGAPILAALIAVAFVAAAIAPRTAELAQTASTPATWIALVALLTLTLRGVWHHGLRAWISSGKGT